jgi:hypothetical protein
MRLSVSSRVESWYRVLHRLEIETERLAKPILKESFELMNPALQFLRACLSFGFACLVLQLALLLLRSFSLSLKLPLLPLPGTTVGC